MNIKPRVSVILATHNNAKILDNSIESIWSSSFSDVELIAVDVNSADGTKELLFSMAKEDEQITYLSDNMGSMGRAKNIGLDKAKGDYIVFMEPGSLFLNDAIEALCDELDSNKDIDLFSCETDCFGNNSYGRRNEDKKIIIKTANEMDDRREEVESRLIRSWMYDGITIYRASYLRKNKIRHYDKPGFGDQDSAFRFLSMVKSRMSVSEDIKYSRRLDLFQNKITVPTAAADVCNEFRFLEEELKKDKELWQRIRLVFWQSFYDRNMIFYEKLAPDLRIKLSKRMQMDIKGAVSRKEYSPLHFDISVRDEMELLMKSFVEFDCFQKEKIRKREVISEAEDDDTYNGTYSIKNDEKKRIKTVSIESREVTEKTAKKSRLNRRWLIEEMGRDLAPLRMLIGLSTNEMGIILGVSENTYKNFESGKKEISWDEYLALLFVFHYNDRTTSVIDSLGLYPELLKTRFKKGVSALYG